jgi:hypothetical protein
MPAKKAATVSESLRRSPRSSGLKEARESIHAAAPGCVEAIRYAIPAFGQGNPAVRGREALPAALVKKLVTWLIKENEAWSAKTG